MFPFLFLLVMSCAKEDVNDFQTQLDELQSSNRRLAEIHEVGFKFENTTFFDIPLNDSITLYDLAYQDLLFIRFTEVQCLECVEQMAAALNSFTTIGKEQVVILLLPLL